MGGRKAIDLTNQRFGRLVVLRRADCANGHARWRCQCDCGGQKVVEILPGFSRRHGPQTNTETFDRPYQQRRRL